ncbi:autotransporter-associated beta strand repeat-containing protein [Desulfolutivibrio sulfodismutans]|nr:autotransporter-associated beta strand repeat-containing protein [Desulfolutivibrio sulfodismutans]
MLTQYSISIAGGLSGAVNASAGAGGNAYGLQGDYVTIDTMSGDITASAGASAYGLMASDGYASYSELLIGTLSGTVVATATTGQAYGLYGENNVKITGNLTSAGKITATAGQAAYGIYAAVDDIIISGRLAGDVEASAASAYGLYAARALTISNGVGSAGSVTATGTTLAQGMGSNTGLLTIANGFAGSVTAEVTGVGAAYGLKGPGIGLTGGLSGAVASTAFGAGQAYGLWAGGDGISIDSVSSTGTVTATAGDEGQAYALYGSSGDVSITGAMSGQITATAGDSGYAYGLYGNSGDISITGGVSGTITATAGDEGQAYALYGSSGDISITGGVSGAIAATAGDSGYAYGLYADGGSISVTGGLSGTVEATVAGATTSSGNAYGLWALEGITIDSVSATGKVTATSTELGAAYGLYASAGSIQITSGLAGSVSAAAGIALGLYASGGVTLASLSGSVTAAGGYGAYGLQSGSSSISITGALSGTVTAKTTDEDLGYAVGLRAATSISIGEVSGTISATTAGTAVPGSTYAYGLYAGGNINGGDADTALLVSGTISARAFGRAYAVYSESGAVNLYVTGALEGVNTHDSEAYAIYAGGSGSSVTLDLAGDASTSLVGKVHLNGGTLTLLGVNSADNLFEGVTDLVVGNGVAAATWTLDPEYANRSSFTNLTIKTNASLSINEFVSITNGIENEGSLTWDTVAGSTAYAGVLSGSGALIKKGDHTLTLSGKYNDYTGVTTVSEGTLQAGVAGAFSTSSAVSVAAGATLDLNDFAQTIHGLSGSGSVTLGSATLTVQNADSYQFDGVISETGGLTKSGTGTLTLGAANTYTGATTVNAGTLRAGAADIIASSSGLSVASGAVFDLNDYDQTITLLSGSGGVTLGSDAATILTLNLGSTDSTFAGVISGAGGLTKTGSGSLTLSGVNTYTGATTVSGGILRLTGSLASASIDLASGTGIAFAAASDTTYAGAVTGSGTLTKSGTATLTLSGANTYTGDTTISGGTLRVTGSLASQSVAVSSGALLDMRPAANATYAGVISGAGGFQKSGAAALTLSGNNTYTGDTTITAGTLRVTGALASQSVAVSSGALFDMSPSADTTYAGVISGAGGFQKSGAAALTLSGNNTYTGDTDITAGTLRVTGSLASQSVDVAAGALFDMSPATNATYGGVIAGAGDFQKSGAATLTLSGNNTYTGDTSITAGTLRLTGSLASQSVAVSSGALLDMSPSADTTYAGVIEGAGDFRKSGAATLTLSGANTYTGDTSITAGILRVTGSLASASVDVASGSLFDMSPSANTTYAGVISGAGNFQKSGAATLTLSGNNTYTGDTAITAGTLRVTGSLASASVDVAAGSLFDMDPLANTTYAGVIEGAGYFRKSGAAALTLSGANTYTGDTTITAGTLRVTGSLASASVNVAAGSLFDMSPTANTTYAGVIEGAGDFRKSGAATLTLSGNNTYTGDTSITAGTLRLTGSLASQSVAVSSGALLDMSPSADTTYAGVIEGAGDFRKSGAATLTLSGANTYTGDTSITAGILRVTGSLASASVDVASGSLFDMSPSANTTYAGVISGAGNFQKSGAATLTLSGNNTYTGDTAITAGTLRVTGSLASASVDVAAGSLFDMDPLANTTYAGVIEGAGYFRKSGAAALTLSGANTYTGDTTITAGTLRVTGSLASASVNVAAGSLFDMSPTANTTYAGVIEGAGDFRKSGAATLTLSGNNTYTGDTAITAGTLRVTGSLVSQSVAVSSGALFDMSPSTNTTYAGVISGAGNFQKSGAATLTLSGNNTYTGATTVSAGTLGVTGSLATSSINVASGATMNFSGSLTNLSSLTNFGTINLTSALTFTDADCTLVSTGSILAASSTDVAILFGAGDDSATFGPGAMVRGIVDGGGGDNTLTLVGSVSLDGAVRNFQSLIKDDSGSWTIGGDVDLGTGTLTVSQGTLILQGGLVASGASIASGGLLDWSPSANTGFAGVISGAGDFQKSGAAALTLSGANTYTGDTTITAGTLRVTGSLASASVNVAAGSLFDMSPTANTTYAGVIEGAGDFRKSGAATLTLSGNNTYTGDTSITAGTLRLTGSLASQSVAVSSGALLDMSPSADTTYAGVIEGAGDFRKSGAATLTLSGANTYTGDTAITAGTLRVIGSLASQSVDVAAGALFDMSPTANTTYAGVISGAGDFRKSGTATLTLSGNNTYTGDTTITAGTLRVTGSLASQSVAVAAGALFDMSPTANTTYAGVISGAGDFRKSGTATLTLSGNNTYTGDTTITAGTLRVTGSLAAASVDVAAGALFGMSPAANTTYAGVISGAGNFQKSGAATLTLSGNNTYTGDTTITAGTLRVTGSLASQSVAVSSGALFDMSPSTNTTYAGVISGAGNFQKSGAATLTLSGNNTYTGATTVSAGTLGVTGSLATSSINVASGATMNFSGSLTNLSSLTNFGTINLTSALTFTDADCTLVSTGSILAASSTDVAILFGAGDDSATFGPGAMVRGIVDGGGGDNTLTLVGSVSLDGAVRNFQSLIKDDSGSWTIGGDVDLGTGTLTVSQGTLILQGGLVASGASIASGGLLDWAPSANTGFAGVISGAGNFQKSGAATLTLSGNNTYTGDTSITAGTLRVTGSLAAASVDVAAGALFGMSPAANTTYAGVISGAGNFQKSGAATLTLSGNNTYTGDTTITAGTLRVTGSLASQSVAVSSGALFDMSPSTNTTYAGVISGAGNFQKSGAATLTLSGNNTYTGATTVSAGTLGVTGSLATSSINVASGATMNFSGSLTNLSSLTNFGTINLTSALTFTDADCTLVSTGSILAASSTDVAILFGAGDDSATFGPGAMVRGIVDGGGGDNTLTLVGSVSLDGAVRNFQSLIKDDSGSWTIGGDVDLGTGTLTVSQGTLILQGGLVASGASIASGGLLDWAPSANTGFAGVISGAGNFQKSGAATLTLSGNNTYTGATTVSAGILRVTGSLASQSVAVSSGALFDMSPLTDTTYAGVISGAGDFRKSGAATLTLSGSNTYTGDTAISAGTLRVTGSLASQSVDVAAGALFDMSPTANTTYAGVIEGAGDFRKSGTATLTLSGNNTYTGDTTITAGTLRVTGSLASQSVAVAAGALFDMSPTANTTYAGVIEGAGDFQKSGAATLTLSGNNTYTGDTTITAGTLRVTGSLASQSVAVSSGALFDMSPAANTTYAGVISGAGNFQKSGAATLTLSGNNTYTGDTTITAGTLRVTGALASQSVAVSSGALFDMSPATNATYSGVISGAGNFQKSGAATLTLSGNNTYTGATTVSAGTLGVTGSLATSSINVASGATMNFSGSLTNLSSLTNAGTINLTSALTFTDADCTLVSTGSILAASSTDVAILFGAGDDSATFGPGAMVRGIVDGGGGDNTLTLVGSVSLDGAVRNFQNLIKDDSGSWTIGGDVDLGTGTLTVSQGTLILQGGLVASGASIASGGLLDWSPSANTGFAGVISGAGDFQKSGAATLTLSGNNTYTGDTSITAGILRVTGSLASASVDVAAGALFDMSPAANTTYAGVISGAGMFLKSGDVTLTLSGDNTYTGATFITAGTLLVTGSLASQGIDVAAGALLDMSPSVDATYAGVISGAGNFVKSGAGLLTLTGNHTYTGDTTITAGTLLVTGSLASQGIDIAAGALLDMNPVVDTLYAGVIEGAGDFVKSGAGLLALTGNHTYTGNTSVTAGTLLVTGSLASQSVEVADGALFDMSPSVDTTYAGIISGAGDFQKSGAGILTLSGANTYTGDTTLTSGILRITGSLASQSIDMAAGTLLDMSPALDATYAGVIEGAGTFLKSGDATLTLSGDNTYTGFTWVMEGDLDVTGSLASLDYQIDAGAGITFASDTTINGDAVVNGTWTAPLLALGSFGTLMGTGTIMGDVESHGTIAPGLSAGTLTIDGDLLLGSGSLLSLEITPTARDLLHVTGATTIDGGSLHVAIAEGYYTTGQQFTLLSSDGGLTGDYETITIDNQSPFLNFSVTNTDTATVGAFGGDVTVIRLPYAIAATTRNSYGASLGLTGATLAATPAMQTILAEIDFMSLGEVAAGLQQMSPEPYSALVETSFSAMRLFSDTIRERAYATRSGGGSVLAMVPGGEMSRMTELASRSIASDASSGITAKSGQAAGLGLFVKPVGQYVGFGKGHNRTGFDAWQYGVVAGGDLAVNDNLLAGFQVGYVHSDLSFSDTAKSSGRSDTFLGGLYGAYSSGGFYADGMVQAGAAWNRLVRKIEFGSISTQPQGTYVSFLLGGSLTTGYDWTFGKFKAGPVATLDYGYVSVPGFSETADAELGLTVRAFSGNSLKSGLGAKVSGTFTVGEKTTVSPDVSLRWGHEFLDNSQNIKARYNGSPTSSFSAKTGEPTRNNLLMDAGVSVGVSDSAKLYLRYSGQIFGRGSQTQAGAVGVRYEF